MVDASVKLPVLSIMVNYFDLSPFLWEEWDAVLHKPSSFFQRLLKDGPVSLQTAARQAQNAALQLLAL